MYFGRVAIEYILFNINILVFVAFSCPLLWKRGTKNLGLKGDEILHQEDT